MKGKVKFIGEPIHEEDYLRILDLSDFHLNTQKDEQFWNEVLLVEEK